MKKILLYLLLLVAAIPAAAQIRGNNITVTVTPDHLDWNYRAGEKAAFVVSVLRSGTPIPGAVIDYEAGPVEFTTVKKQGVTLKDGTMRWTASLKQPGFYRLAVTAHVGGKEYKGLCTAAFSPEKVRPMTQCPDDFMHFWQKALTDARHTNLVPTRRLLPDRCTDKANVYEVSYQNEKWGSRMYGILSIPVRPGRYPALLRVPGAGVRPYAGDTYTRPDSLIVLEIGIHGIPVTMEQKVYDNLLNGALASYSFTNLDDANQNYYKRVITGAVRGVDYIASLPEWDGRTLGVTGASQGGFLSLAVAALDKRVTCLAAVHDAMCDYESELKGVAGGWPHYYLYDKHPSDQKVRALRYYDGVNFARHCTVPAWFSFGYNDEVVPPQSSYGIYNIYPAQKSLSVYQLTGHFWFQEQWDEWQDWLRAHLK